MKIVAIIQARMGSTRLPGKVMKMLCGKTVLYHVISRVKACPLIDEVVVATSFLPADDVIEKESKSSGANCFRGSEDNVLERYYLAAKKFKADIVVRITSDCPLLDPELLQEMIERFKQSARAGNNIDYLSNSMTRSYPRGLDIEIFTFDSLEKAYKSAQKPYEKEHVTPYICQHPEAFLLDNQINNKDLSSHRWTLDTQEDFIFIEKIYTALDNGGRFFNTKDILSFLRKNPELLKINSHIKQKDLKIE